MKKNANDLYLRGAVIRAIRRLQDEEREIRETEGRVPVKYQRANARRITLLKRELERVEIRLGLREGVEMVNGYPVGYSVPLAEPQPLAEGYM